MTVNALFVRSTLRRSAVAVAMGACTAAAYAATPPFTFNPAAVGLAGAAFTADNVSISDYSLVRSTGTTFTETGFLAVTGFQLGDNSALIVPGLNTTYGLYVKFDGTGTSTTSSNPLTTATSGSFSTLSFTLYGYNGSATFGIDGSGNPFETAAGEIVLATGSLQPGGNFVSTNPAQGSFFANAGATLSFNVDPARAGFFAAPNPFYGMALTSFTNTPSNVVPFDGGFRVIKGGGTINFVAVPAVPEPETYALLLAGLGAIGFVARRRRT
ncbi:MAG: flocculation-associated PEP-CTERM protein PepA [Pseudomonadota bacterium]